MLLCCVLFLMLQFVALSFFLHIQISIYSLHRVDFLLCLPVFFLFLVLGSSLCPFLRCFHLYFACCDLLPLVWLCFPLLRFLSFAFHLFSFDPPCFCFCCCHLLHLLFCSACTPTFLFFCCVSVSCRSILLISQRLPHLLSFSA